MEISLNKKNEKKNNKFLTREKSRISLKNKFFVMGNVTELCCGAEHCRLNDGYQKNKRPMKDAIVNKEWMYACYLFNTH